MKNQAISRPLGGQELIIADDSGREFGGIVTGVEEIQDAVSTQLDYQLDTRDYSFLLDRHRAVKEYAQGAFTYDQIVKDLVATYGAKDGFTTNGVMASFQSEFTRIEYQPVGQSIGLIADKISWAWGVDYYRDVKFFPQSTNVSPLPGNTLDADNASTISDPTYGQLGIYSDLRIKEDVSQVKNRVFMYGHKVTDSHTYTETFTGDGLQLAFPLAYEPSHTLTNIAVTVGGTVYAPAADLAAGGPSNTAQDFTAYVNWNTLVVRFNVAPTNGTSVVVAYKPMFPLVVMVEDPQDQAIMKTRTGLPDGAFEDAISDPTLSADTVAPSTARGQFAIAKYGTPHISGQFTSFLHGWRAGQFFHLTSARRFGGQFNGDQLFVTKVEKQLVSHPAGTRPLFKSTVYFSDNVFVF